MSGETMTNVDTIVAAISSRLILRLIAETDTDKTYTATEVSEMVAQVLLDVAEAWHHG